MRVVMLVSSGLAYFLNGAIAKARYGQVDRFNFEAPLTWLVWLTSIISILMTYAISAVIIPTLGDDAPYGGSWRRLFPAERSRAR